MPADVEDLDLDLEESSPHLRSDVPWNDQGMVLPEGISGTEALVRSGLDWETRKEPLFLRGDSIHYPDGTRYFVGRQVEDTYALVRSDTQEILGRASRAYVPYQNRDLARWVDQILRTTSAAVLRAGSLSGGRRVWMLLNLPEQRFALAQDPGDLVDAYVLAATSHDRSISVTILPLPTRRCSETLMAAAIGRATDGFRLSHFKTVSRAEQQITLVLSDLGRVFGKFAEILDQMTRVPLSETEMMDYYREVWPDPEIPQFVQRTASAEWLARIREEFDVEDRLNERHLRTEAERNYEIRLAMYRNRRHQALQRALLSPANQRPGVQGTLAAAYLGACELVTRKVNAEEPTERYKVRALEALWFGSRRKELVDAFLVAHGRVRAR